MLCRLGLGGAHPSGAAVEGASGHGDRGGAAVQKKRHLSKRERAALKKGLTLEELHAQQVLRCAVPCCAVFL